VALCTICGSVIIFLSLIIKVVCAESLKKSFHLTDYGPSAQFFLKVLVLQAHNVVNKHMANISKLKGRENYGDWTFAAENFLILDGMQKYIDGTETDTEKNRQGQS